VWQNVAKIGPGTLKNWWTEKRFLKITRPKYNSIRLSLYRYAGDCNNCSYVCALCTTVVQNTTQNSSDNFPFYPPDNHHSTDDVYWRGGGTKNKELTVTYNLKHPWQQNPLKRQLIFVDVSVYDVYRRRRLASWMCGRHVVRRWVAVQQLLQLRATIVDVLVPDEVVVCDSLSTRRWPFVRLARMTTPVTSLPVARAIRCRFWTSGPG